MRVNRSLSSALHILPVCLKHVTYTLLFWLVWTECDATHNSPDCSRPLLPLAGAAPAPVLHPLQFVRLALPDLLQAPWWLKRCCSPPASGMCGHAGVEGQTCAKDNHGLDRL